LIKLDVGDASQGFVGWNDLDVVADSAGEYKVYAEFESGGQVVETNWELEVV